MCDGLDNDCDSVVDDGATNLYYEDSDSDLYGNGEVFEGCTQPTYPGGALAYYEFNSNDGSDATPNNNDSDPDAGITYSTNTHTGTGKSASFNGSN